MNPNDRVVDSYGRCRIKDNSCRSSRPWLAYDVPATVSPAAAEAVVRPSLLAEALRAALEGSSWADTSLGWVNTTDTIRVREVEENTGIELWHRTAAGNWDLFPTFIPAATGRQAIDVLAALEVLPQRLSSAYEAGFADATALKRVSADLTDMSDADLDRLARKNACLPGENAAEVRRAVDKEQEFRRVYRRAAVAVTA